MLGVLLLSEFADIMISAVPFPGKELEVKGEEVWHVIDHVDQQMIINYPKLWEEFKAHVKVNAGKPPTTSFQKDLLTAIRKALREYCD